MVGILRRSVTHLVSSDGTGLAAELAYRAFLALVPFLIFLVALSSVLAGVLGVNDPAERLVDLLGATVPGNVAALLRDQLRSILERPQPGLLSIGFVGALWAATGGMNALIKAMDRAFGVPESRPFWRRYAVSVGLTVLAAALAIVAVAVLALAGIAGVSALLSLPVVVLLLFIAAAAVYRVGVDLRLPFSAVVPGAAVFALLWAAGTYGFSLYVSRFATYDATYGSLGAVVVLLVWLYLVALVLVYGAELNAAIAEARMPRYMEEERLQRGALRARYRTSG